MKILGRLGLRPVADRKGAKSKKGCCGAALVPVDEPAKHAAPSAKKPS